VTLDPPSLAFYLRSVGVLSARVLSVHDARKRESNAHLKMIKQMVFKEFKRDAGPSSATHPFVWDLYFELWQGYLPHDTRKA